MSTVTKPERKPAMDEVTKNVTTRLRRIEGQVQGIQRMLESGRECEEILTQIMAVRSSMDHVGLLLMEMHIENCLLDGLPPDSPVTKEISEVLKSWARFGLVPGARSDVPSPG
jgi:CsoR family transcriptional regulator, copper-sensing transcriptional repressor